MTSAESYTTKNALLHHGILGQKWGITNGPPYPLDSSVSTGKKLKKNITDTKQIVLNAGDNVTSEQKKAYKNAIKEGKAFVKKHYSVAIKQEKKQAKTYAKEADKARNKGFKARNSAAEYQDDNILPARILNNKAQKYFNLAKENDARATLARVKAKDLIKEKKNAKYWMLKSDWSE